jgi:hypothetical protein
MFQAASIGKTVAAMASMKAIRARSGREHVPEIVEAAQTIGKLQSRSGARITTVLSPVSPLLQQRG